MVKQRKREAKKSSCTCKIKVDTHKKRGCLPSYSDVTINETVQKFCKTKNHIDKMLGDAMLFLRLWGIDPAHIVKKRWSGEGRIYEKCTG